MLSATNGNAALPRTVTKPREWDEKLLLMSVLPDYWLPMTGYGYFANPYYLTLTPNPNPEPHPNPNPTI